MVAILRPPSLAPAPTQADIHDMPAVAMGAHCVPVATGDTNACSFRVPPGGAVVVNGTTNGVLVDATIIHQGPEDNQTYTLRSTECPNTSESHTSNKQTFPLQVVIHPAAWNDVFFVVCTMKLTTTRFGSTTSEGPLVIVSQPIDLIICC